MVKIRQKKRAPLFVTELQRFKQDEVLVLKHRLPPLRTKFLPFWNTDFGYGKNNSSIPKAELPTHEQRSIKLFDIREFVKKKKEEKRNEMFNGNNPFGGGNPFVNNANPFGPSNPFGGSNQSSNPFLNAAPSPNPFGGSTSGISNIPTSNTDDDDLDIDSIIKKIDAKIQELENEEKEDNKLKDELAKEELSSNSAILSSDKIKIDDKSSVKPVSNNYDMMDDFMEDISADDVIEPKEEKSNKPEIKEPPKEDNKKEEIYTNKEEINKIMNEKDDDSDLFDDFFE